MKINLKKSVLLFLLVLANTSYSQEVKELFQSDELLKITLKFDINEVTSDIKTREEREAELSYLLPDGEIIAHKIKINVRGNSRTNTDVCRFPPLKLNFKKKKVKNTLFNGQDKLKLVTHCNSTKKSENYVKKEYLIYKLYQSITNTSIRARMCEITYVDLGRKGKTFTEIGILLEDVDDVAKRNDLKVFKDVIRTQESMNKVNLDNLVFFQYMIGNLDWSISKRHNVKVVKDKKKGLPIAIPYDFDFSGFVDTSYAVPPAGFDIPSVKTRIFRGYCRINNYNSTIKFYQSKKDELYTTIKNATFLDDKNQTTMVNYLDDFYTILNNPRKLDKNIIKACRGNHTHTYQR